jgi:hypothetical protein
MTLSIPHFNLPLLPSKALKILDTQAAHFAQPKNFESVQIPMTLTPTGTVEWGFYPEDAWIPTKPWNSLLSSLTQFTRDVVTAYKKELNVDLFNGQAEGVHIVHQWGVNPIKRSGDRPEVPLHQDRSKGVAISLIRPMVDGNEVMSQATETLSLVPKEKGLSGKSLSKLGVTSPPGIIEVPYQQGHTLGFIERDHKGRIITLHGVRATPAPRVTTPNGHPIRGWGGPDYTYYDVFDRKTDPDRVSRIILSSFINPKD